MQYLYNWLGHANSAINPWLYLTLSETLRKDFCEVVKRDRHSNSRYFRFTRYQTSTKHAKGTNVYNDVLLQDVRMDRKEINCVLNEKEKQICSETNV